MVICSVTAANHLPKAACLASSLARTQAKHQFVLCLVEQDYSAVQHLVNCFSRIVLASEIGIPNFSSFVFRHNRYEACCAVKAQFLEWAMQNFPEEEQFLFLDPDFFAYSRFEELESILPQSDIVVTPHILHDDDSLEWFRDNLFRVLISGTFNLGFLAIRRSGVGLDFMRWWNRKLQMLCYMEWRSRGLFVDQKWVLLALSLFEITILREPGYNVANWNVSKRCLASGEQPGSYLVNGKPLRCFHFSGIDSGRDMYYLAKYLRDDSPVFAMREQYLRDVSVFDVSGLSRKPWSYDRFFSGERVSDDARYVYRNNSRIIQMFPEPFSASNAALFSAMIPSPRLEPKKQPSVFDNIKLAYGRWRSEV